MATVIVKVTERCNGVCAYCDVIRKEPSAMSDLSLDLADELLRRVDEYLAPRPDAWVDLVWHGGEPLLRGTEFYRELRRLITRRCPTTRDRLRHFMQSNLSLLDEDMVRALKELGLASLGTSYDPLPRIRNWSGPGGEDELKRRFMGGLALLEREQMGWGMIYVVTRPSLKDPVGIYRHLCNLCPQGAVTFNPVLLYGGRRPDLALDDDAYGDFLLQILELWWPERHRFPLVQPLARLTARLEGRSAHGSCSESGACAADHLNVGPDGRLSLCGRAADFALLDFGRIGERPLAELFELPERVQLLKRDDRLLATDCRDCRLFPLCHGGCPLDAWDAHRSFERRSPKCRSFRRLVEEGLEPRLGIRFGEEGKSR